MTSTPLDTEAKALIGKIKFYLLNPSMHSSDALDILRQQYTTLSNLPIQEFSPEVWDELDEVYQQLM